MVLFKTHHFFTVCTGKSTFVLLTLSFLFLSAEEALLQVCGDHITEWMSGGQQNN
jgi:hypothetical protein